MTVGSAFALGVPDLIRYAFVCRPRLGRHSLRVREVRMACGQA